MKATLQTWYCRQGRASREEPTLGDSLQLEDGLPIPTRCHSQPRTGSADAYKDA